MILYYDLYIITMFKLDILLVYLCYKFKKFYKFFKKFFINKYFLYNFSLQALVKKAYMLKTNSLKIGLIKTGGLNSSFFFKNLHLKRKKKLLHFYFKNFNIMKSNFQFKIKKLIIKKIDNILTFGMKYKILLKKNNFFKRVDTLTLTNSSSNISVLGLSDNQFFKNNNILTRLNRLKWVQFKASKYYKFSYKGKYNRKKNLFANRCFFYTLPYSSINFLQKKQNNWLRLKKFKKIRKPKKIRIYTNKRFSIDFKFIFNGKSFTYKKLNFFKNLENFWLQKKIYLANKEKKLLFLKLQHTPIFKSVNTKFLKKRKNVRNILTRSGIYVYKHLFFYIFFLLKQRTRVFKFLPLKSYLTEYVYWIKIKKQMNFLTKYYNYIVLYHIYSVKIHKLIINRHLFFKKTTILVSKNTLFNRKKKFYSKKKRSRTYKSKFFLQKLTNLTPTLFLKKRISILHLLYIKVFKKYLKYKNLLLKKFVRKIKTILYKNRKTSKRLAKVRRRVKGSFYSFKHFLWGDLRNVLYLLKFSLIHKNINFLRYVHLTDTSNSIIKNYSLPLNKRIFLKQKLINTNLINYYFNAYKKYTNIKYTLKLSLSEKKLKLKRNKTRIIFLNISDPLLGKLRETRKLHWKLFKTGKLNERRYSKFLIKMVYNKFINFNQNIFILLIFQLFGRLFSWHHITLIFDYRLYTINGLPSSDLLIKKGDIFESTISFYYKLIQKWFLLSNKKYLNRVKRWSFINYCRYKNPFLKKRKKLPKILKKLPLSIKSAKNWWLIDYSIHCAILNQDSSQFNTASSLNITNSTVVKLYNWRYVP